MTTTTQCEHAQTEALFYASALENCAEVDFDRIFVPAAAVIRRLHTQVAALTAQPAAPQGVAYADAHGAIMGAAYDFRDAHISGSPNQKRSAHAALESAVTHALRASNGQAPASRITVEQVEDAVGLQSTAWDTIGAEKIVEAVLRLANGQAPAGATLFDEQGFRDWVLRNLPDDTIIGNGVWWAEHLTAWAKRFIKAATTAQAAPAPTHEQIAAYLEATGAYVTNDASREAAIADAVAAHEAQAAPAGAVNYVLFTAGVGTTQGSWEHGWNACMDAVLAAAPTPAAQADSVLAPVRDVEREAFKAAHRHLELDEVPDAWARPMFKHSHVEASWLGWIARAARVSENGQPATQGNELLTVAERNIRSFLRSATFKSESDREAALSCVDVLWAAARAPTDSVLEDAARLAQIEEAIRDYHHALDMRKHGGLAESVAFNSICQTMGMTWNQGEEEARRAARKQGGA